MDDNATAVPFLHAFNWKEYAFLNFYMVMAFLA